MAREPDEIYRAIKHIVTAPDWKQRPNDEYLRLVCPLDIDGQTVEGLRFAISANSRLPDGAVSFQVEYFPPRRSSKGGPICRVEWRPIKAHNNKGIGPPEFRHVLQKGCHHHPFELNWEHSQPRVRRGFLDIAVPIVGGFSTFHEALAFVGKEFRINGLEDVPVPPWSEQLPWS